MELEHNFFSKASRCSFATFPPMEGEVLFLDGFHVYHSYWRRRQAENVRVYPLSVHSEPSWFSSPCLASKRAKSRREIILPFPRRHSPYSPRPPFLHISATGRCEASEQSKNRCATSLIVTATAVARAVLLGTAWLHTAGGGLRGNQQHMGNSSHRHCHCCRPCRPAFSGLLGATLPVEVLAFLS